MCANIIPLSHCALKSNIDRSIAKHNGIPRDSKRFNADVKDLVAVYSDLEADCVALYYEEAYPFCVSLFALLHSNKKVCIAGNNKVSTANHLIGQGYLLLGDWQGKMLSIETEKGRAVTLEPLDLYRNQLIIYTSGSSAQPKAISKTLQQLQNEIETLEQNWGQSLGQAQVIATVSHQHIYGLLFRVLWPLAAGRCFYSEMYHSPEPLLKVASNVSAYWVASPAQLKRLDELTPWQEMSRLVTIFSSGGALPPEAATQIHTYCGHKVIEVYGSSETGGIAWRQYVDEPLWTVFDGINITVDAEGVTHLSSPYLAEQKPYILEDKIQLNGHDHFALLGRIDRIVKVEEKRLSLDALEQSLNGSKWVQQSYTLLLTNKRDKIAAVLILTEMGEEFLHQQGRAELIKQLRKQLMLGFETVVLPRKWLFMPSFPLTAQGKINRELLVQLLSLETTRFPQILSFYYYDECAELQFRVLPELIYFSGHFPKQPILPGVAQLAWTEHLGKIIFNIEQPFLRMEVIKFKKIIRPGDIIQMKLNWKADIGKLYFELNSVGDTHGSGRLVYG